MSTTDLSIVVMPHKKTPHAVPISETQCACCKKVHDWAPAGSRVKQTEWIGKAEISGGLFFECDCKSTLFILWDRVKVECAECFDAEPEGNGEDCVNCCYDKGHEFMGMYCNDCGEARDGSHNLND